MRVGTDDLSCEGSGSLAATHKPSSSARSPAQCSTSTRERGIYASIWTSPAGFATTFMFSTMNSRVCTTDSRQSNRCRPSRAACGPEHQVVKVERELEEALASLGFDPDAKPHSCSSA